MRYFFIVIVGMFVVSSAQAHNNESILPKGSYQATCSDCSTDGRGMLSCRCQGNHGEQYDTSLYYWANGCASIENVNGQLRCLAKNSPETIELNAGIINSQGEANQTCPTVCREDHKHWTGQWSRSSEGSYSVCQCTDDWRF